MTGAARLIASAAGRIGAGLVTVATPQSVLAPIQAGLTEATFLPLPETAKGTIAADALEPLLGLLTSADAVAVGPGLTANPDTSAFLRELVHRSPVPMVIDADGLNAFTGRAADIAERQAEAVLTPHVGEFGRLSGVKPRDLEADRLSHVRSLAASARAVALLKGSRSVIASSDGEVRINPTGSPVLATAGTGDVLTGIIGGLLARGVGALDAASAGAYLHGLSGLIAGADRGEGTMAGDLVDRIPDAVRRVVET